MLTLFQVAVDGGKDKDKLPPLTQNKCNLTCPFLVNASSFDTYTFPMILKLFIIETTRVPMN